MRFRPILVTRSRQCRHIRCLGRISCRKDTSPTWTLELCTTQCSWSSIHCWFLDGLLVCTLRLQAVRVVPEAPFPRICCGTDRCVRLESDSVACEEASCVTAVRTARNQDGAGRCMARSLASRDGLAAHTKWAGWLHGDSDQGRMVLCPAIGRSGRTARARASNAGTRPPSREPAREPASCAVHRAQRFGDLAASHGRKEQHERPATACESSSGSSVRL